MKSIKKRWNDFLKRLAKSNKGQFGSEPPDCCGDSKSRPTKNKKNKYR